MKRYRAFKLPLDSKHRQSYLLSIYYSAPSQSLWESQKNIKLDTHLVEELNVFQKALEKVRRGMSSGPQSCDVGGCFYPVQGPEVLWRRGGGLNLEGDLLIRILPDAIRGNPIKAGLTF